MSDTRRLPTCVLFHKDETPESLMARTARANSFYSLAEFCGFTGVPRAAIATMNEQHLDRLVDWTGVGSADLMKFASRSASVVEFGFDRVRKTQLRGSSRRYCPHCFAHDLEQGTDQPNARIYMRATWRFNMISDCPDHGVRLAELPVDFDLLDLRDFVATTKPKQEENNPSPHSKYFSDRLLGRTSGSYLDSLPLYVAAELCSVLGALKQKMVDNKISEHVPLGMANPECLAPGYSIACEGRESIWKFLTAYVVKVIGRATKYPMVFSLPLRWLRDESADGDFGSVRAIFQEHAECHLPMAPGESFLEPVPRRRVHTTYTAAKEYGISEGRIRDILVNQDDGKSVIATFKGRGIVFHRDEAHPLLEAASQQLTTKQAAERLGCAMTQMEALLIGGMLPFTSNGASSTRVYRWVSELEVNNFIQRIRSRVTEPSAKYNLVPILIATKVCRRIFPEIIALILDGTLKRVHMNGSAFGLCNITVDPDEIDGLSDTGVEEDYLGRKDAAAFLRTSVETIKDLIDLGVLSATIVRHKKTNLPMDMMLLEELNEFREKYVVLDDLSKTRQVRSIKVRFDLEKLGVQPAYEGSRNASKVYHRSDIKRVGF